MIAEDRILVLTPTGRDAELVASALRQARLAYHVCDGWAAIEHEAAGGAAAILVSEEALNIDGARRLRHLLQRQPAWSDLPVMLLVARSADASAR